MDEYAMLLRSRGEHMDLNRLVHELISIDATRPEVWVAAAVYWEMRDDKIRALTYADKVRFLTLPFKAYFKVLEEERTRFLKQKL
jgi:hypothetical protein